MRVLEFSVCDRRFAITLAACRKCARQVRRREASVAHRPYASTLLAERDSTLARICHVQGLPSKAPALAGGKATANLLPSGRRLWNEPGVVQIGSEWEDLTREKGVGVTQVAR